MEELELLRIKTRKRLVITAIILSVVLMPLPVFLFGSMMGGPSYSGADSDFILKMLLIVAPAAMGVVLALGITYALTTKVRREYKEAFLELFVKKEFEQHFENVAVNSTGFDKDVIFNEGLILTGNRYYSNDCITGEYKGMSFSKADVLIQQVTSNGKTSTTTTYFNGQVINVDGLNKMVQRVYVENNALKTPSRSGFFSKSEFEKVDTESVVFNGLFDVFARDAHDAFYVLTPHVMERFISFPRKTGFGVSLNDHSAQLALDTGRDSLESSIFRQIKEKDIQGVREDIEAIKITIDLLLEADSLER